MVYKLSDRELEVLWAVAEYGGPGPAAEALGLATQTVKNHLASILAKTDSRTALQAYHRITGGRRFHAVVTVSYEESPE